MSEKSSGNTQKLDRETADYLPTRLQTRLTVSVEASNGAVRGHANSTEEAQTRFC
jgi:hypothetical protein